MGPKLCESGIHFSLRSEHATAVDLCLFEAASSEKESQRIPLEKGADSVWRVHAPNLSAGCLYGYRVHGPYQPDKGHRFNPSKILIDPYAKALGRPMQWHKALHSVPPGISDQHDHPPDTQDSAPYAPLAKVVDLSFDWEEDNPPVIPWEDTFIYETHVKGMTQRHPGIPEHLRGTYTGLCSEPMLEHLSRLGITTIELLPVHQIADEYHLHKSGLTNYWGYNPLLLFAPDSRFARRDILDPLTEFKQMVRTFHHAGFEVILDMVFNHTAEGNLHGPTVSFRGIDNAMYYRTEPGHPEHYANYTGCGNTLNLHHPSVLRLVLDALRYWVEDMHVDGFRLDLAVTVGRGRESFEPEGSFFRSIQEDPILSKAKWIAEPWDLGADGYQLSHFPRAWSEWNDQFRQTVRKFWRGDTHQGGALRRRVSGSRDLFGPRAPLASINYITSHDGFTLEDLVSYEHKHNEANGENNHDGHNGNDSCNYGAEGPSDDPALTALRQQQKRNLLATLMLSAGIPMISGGDEIGRTQQGNNNAYCQDNPISWYDWSLKEDQKIFLDFARSLSPLRKQFLFNQAAWQWFQADGHEIYPPGHDSFDGSSLGCFSSQHPALLILWNSGDHPCEFTLPCGERPWQTLVDTSSPNPEPPSATGKTLKTLTVPEHSLKVLIDSEKSGGL
ncbi:MAG: glycogen debranching protein GlgX [Nitrospinota bacterium]|nr:glycogen debranching protein GlgX [Nitrospinota bacterium]